jgi:hypothetical protein
MPHSPTLNSSPEKPSNPRLGRCYELAGEFALMGDEGVILVHGSIQGFGNPRLKHAWVELPNGSVWEPASNKEWDRQVFDRVFNPQADNKYDQLSVAKYCTQHEHWGPW